MADTLQSLRQAAARAHKNGALDDALGLYAQYLAQRPGDAGIWSNLGALHRSAGRHQMALRAHRKALSLAPDAVGYLNNMANVLSDVGAYEESIALRRRILEREPDDMNHLAMIGRCLRGQGRYEAAIAHLSQAREQFPDDAELQLQLAFAQLGAGDYAEGLSNYKARWRAGELTPRKLSVPEWQGETLEGKTILVLPEQGFGDAVLFARFLPWLKAQGCTVRLLTEGPLLRLFAGIDGADAVVTTYKAGDPADYWVNMMDLAQHHFAGGGDVPAPVKLHVPEDSLQRAKQFVAPHRAAFRVGVVWSGSATYKGNVFRSFSHTDYLPLTEIPGIQLFSLYKGPYLQAYQADGTSAFILDTASTDRDFADCAATMKQMDVIITSDTATAHIAGSLGVPVWTILHWDPFWVWRHTGEATAWYPTMRLFRQYAPLDWDSVIGDVGAALRTKMGVGT